MRLPCVFSPILGLLAVVSTHAQVSLTEVMSAGSDRLLRWTADGQPRLGFGTPWYQDGYSESAWFTGNGPFGFGTFANVAPTPAFGTDLTTQMLNLTPTLYLRKAFTVGEGDAARADALELVVQYNDGFVAYLNGVEVARRGAWANGQFLYHDQPAANGTPAHGELSTNPGLRAEVISLGAASGRLRAGENLLAVHALNHWEASTSVSSALSGVSVNNKINFFFKGDLRVTGSPALTLVANTSAWRFFPGVAEPAGGVLDPALLFSGRRVVDWGAPAFNDASWAAGAAPFGAGTPPSGVTLGTNVGGAIIGATPSLYLRARFPVTAGNLADPRPLQLLVGQDDGFVAYLNGVEVARARLGVANSFVPHTAVADSANTTPQTSVTYTLDPPAAMLREGQNVLAVQVHNVSVSDPDLFLRAQLRTNILGSNQQLVGYTSSWTYFPGTEEPLPEADEEQEDLPEGPDAAPDWVELHNPDAVPAPLTGWSLSDDPEEPRKWSFPAGVTLGAGARLVVVCDGADVTAPPTNGLFHTNFGLDADGETLLLTDPAGVSQVVPVPALTAFTSWGRDAGGVWAHQESPSPGAVNTGVTFPGQTAAPVLSPPGGIFASGLVVNLSCPTPGATLRYTLDGREPTDASPAYVNPLAVAAGTALRVRATAAGLLPSRVVTASYLVESNAGRRNLPALSFVGDPARSLYRPFGIFSLVNGSHPGSGPMSALWVAGTGTPPLAAIDTSAYNIPLYRGRFNERPVVMQLFNNGGGGALSTEAGLRVSASGHSRPRVKFSFQTNPDPNAGSWPGSTTEKGSMNVYFRDDLGGRPLDFPVFPGQPVTSFDSLRVRAGKNDISNPFIRDEHARRLFVDMGQVGSRGLINTLYVNGVYKGYYNLTAHLKEGFFQHSFGSDLPWDVIQVNVVSSGDNLALQELVTFLRDNSLASLANYQGAAERVDLVNFADYILLNTFTATGDWPHNNFVTSRERSTSGRFRFHVWDAEGVYGSFTTTLGSNPFSPAAANTTAQGVVRAASPATDGLQHVIRILYTYLAASPEFRLLFADRIQRHMLDGGALSRARVLARWNELKANMASAGVTVSDTDNNNAPYWVNGKGDNLTWTTHTAANRPSRYRTLLNGFIDGNSGGVRRDGYYVTEGLWPATRAPDFDRPAGAVAPGALVAITHTNAAGAIYFTTDGRDPRAPGGAAQGDAYAGPVAIDATLNLKARVLQGGEWSPLRERLYAVSATPPLRITEIHYNPPAAGAVSGEEFEFIEVKNTGSLPVALGRMAFSNALDHTFADGTVIAPGGFAVVARIPARFTERYPGVPVLPEGYGPAGSLANGGETLALVDAAGHVVTSVPYGDESPWPEDADGEGHSLVPLDPAANPASAGSWRPSTRPGGSPGADDPDPASVVRVTELLANPAPGFDDWVEIHNPGPAVADLGDWWLSDSLDQPQKYRIAAGTQVPAGGYLVLTQAQFGAGTNGFSFAAEGEEAVLSAGDASGALTGPAHRVAYGAGESGRSFGEHVNSQGRFFFTAQEAPTPGAANLGPRVGPVVLTELRPAPAPGAAEFVEVRNLSPAPVALHAEGDPARVWRVGGIGYDFPPGTVLQPRQLALVVAGDPAAFRAAHGVPAAVPVLGPIPGSLNNAGERVALSMPGRAVTNGLGQVSVPYIELDALAYDDDAPWPDLATQGLALERVRERGFGDDPAHWRAASPASAGRPSDLTFAAWTTNAFTAAERGDSGVSGPQADPDGDGLSNLGEWAMGLDPRSADHTPSPAEWLDDAGQTYLGLRARRSLSATGLGFFSDTGDRPHDWTLGGGVGVGAPVPNGDGSETVAWRDTIPLSSATNRVLRLRMTAP